MIQLLGSGRSNASVRIQKNKIIKTYFDHSSAEKRFNNELDIYLFANENKLSYIPKLISYDREKRNLVIKNVGTDLQKYLSKHKKKSLKDFLPGIKKIYDDFISHKIYHNDLRKKNVLYNKKNNKLYLIDFENSGSRYLDTDHEGLVKMIKNIKKTNKRTKLRSKRIKRKRKSKRKSKRIKGQGNKY